MTIAEILLGLALALHANHPEAKEPEQLARIRAVVNDMVAEGQARPIFQGEAGPAATAAALYAVAHHESGFWSKVQDCSVCFPGSAWCDRGRSVTLFQLRQGSSSWGDYTRAELCSDNRKATERAAHVLRAGARTNASAAMFGRYAGGIGISKAARELDSIFRSTCAKLKVVVGPSRDGLKASFRTTGG